MRTNDCIFLSYWWTWLGEKKYDYLLRQNVNLKGKWRKNGGKWKMFIVHRGKNIILGEKGGGQKYHILGKYTPLGEPMLNDQEQVVLGRPGYTSK